MPYLTESVVYWWSAPLLGPLVKNFAAAAGGGVMPQTYAQLEIDRDWWRSAYFDLLSNCQNLVAGVVRALERDVDIDMVTDPDDVND